MFPALILVFCFLFGDYRAADFDDSERHNDKIKFKNQK